ncbi:hypothetical protein [Myxococcus virescens]|uniref:Uncharacterized protein n=1 Tax=Myxococcus virescens TaxID=83456 RepID=A0A511HNQ0_9BACT|nr:hypothetical protein [Myxococcus virescens]GEL75206.1 hypothetical protein MVI01_69900 [Myxococcus virescens]SDD65227.1 hypothetical protein SAMN04488504_102131 [Myxococcus virescens]
MDIRHLLTQVVTVAPYVAANDFGEPGYGPQRQVQARVEKVLGIAQEGATGSEARASAVLVVAERIGPQDRVWLPGSNVADPRQAQVPGPDGVTEGIPLAGTGAAFYEIRLV